MGSRLAGPLLQHRGQNKMKMTVDMTDSTFAGMRLSCAPPGGEYRRVRHLHELSLSSVNPKPTLTDAQYRDRPYKKVAFATTRRMARK